MTRPLTVFLIDGSGSMRPAWDKAWSTLFEKVREDPRAFVVLVFKQRLNMTDLNTTSSVPDSVHYVDGVYLIDYGKILSQKRNHRLKRIPEPDVSFTGWTPLNDAIIATIKLMEERYRKTGVPYHIIVISDNRDSRSHATWEDVVQVKAAARGLKKLSIMSVGEFLNKYLEPYDEVLA